MLGGRTDALSVYLLWMKAGIKSKNSIAPVEPMVKKISTGAMEVFCSREHVLVDLNSSSAPVEPTLQNQSTGAMTQAWILCQNPNGYNLDTERPVEPTPQLSDPSVLPVVSIFLQWTSNGYVTLSTLYKGTPWLI